MAMNNRDAESANRAHWDEVAPVHLKSYGVEGLVRGESWIDGLQKRELYPVAGKDLIHLQCHIGTDTLSLARDGARVTGVDFSPASLAVARELAEKMGLQVDFIESNVLELAGKNNKKFDIVYTSKGVLGWISDITKWAETISSLLKPGGVFYIFEQHPLTLMFDDTLEGELKIKYSYFHQDEPTHWDDDHPDYSDQTYVPKNKTYEWFWPLADIVNAVIRAGLVIELLNEHDVGFHRQLPDMTKGADGWWRLEKYGDKLPLTFSLRAKNPL
ncbi:MAG: class I SAM-dependent methyltransferase [Spirochaetales bacterium]|nr:class I SAM-dependent methyltransferase [Spirochaetales bacterium]